MTFSIFRNVQLPALLALLAIPARASVNEYCFPQGPNSYGPGASIQWVGPENPQSGGLLVQGAVPHKFGAFIYSLSPTDIPFGDGHLCVGAPSLILARRFANHHGSVWFRVWQGAEDEDLQWLTHPQNWGATWHFQYMYRDPAFHGTGFNLSNGVAVQFSP